MVPPLIISNTGNMYRNWLSWKLCFLDYMRDNDLFIKSEAFKINLLRNKIGPGALNCIEVNKIMYNTCIEHKLCNYLKDLDFFFLSIKNEVVERFKFFTRSLHKDETLEHFIYDLKEKASTCNFGYLTESLIRDKVVASIHDPELREKLFITISLGLETLELICEDHNNQKRKKEFLVNRINAATEKIKIIDNNGKIVEEKQTEAGAVCSNNDVKEAEQSQSLYEQVNANDETNKDSKNDNDKIAFQGNSNINSSEINEKETDAKILGKKLKMQGNSNENNEAKKDFENRNSDHDKNTAYQENSNNNNETKTDLKSGNTGILKKKPKMHTGSRGNNNENRNFITSRTNTNIKDERQINFKGTNNSNMNTARRNNETVRRCCWRCNENHPLRSCPAWGHKCDNCGERNHFSYCCRHEGRRIKADTPTKSSYSKTILQENVLKPTPTFINNIPAPTEAQYPKEAAVIPSAPVLYEYEDAIYPNFQHVATSQENLPLNPQASLSATGNKQHKTHSTSRKESCSIL
ncbi:uncharacterized protein LOC117227968 [Megalopta genalis]|uniref:uncharacterized protein LOC117227968 n=1 Tax=Megalopta genalis TaxID=115081 RepID=UPI003FD225B2